MKYNFTASWIKNRPAYWINGIRVSRKKGYEHSFTKDCPLPEQFHEWHKKHD